jgi:hypothetical protein
MAYFRSLTLAAVVVGAMATSAAAQEPPPSGPFKAVHIVNLTPQQVATLQAWMADMNAAIAKAGHKDVRYRLYKVIGKQSGQYEFMWESEWPSGEVYQKVHSRPEWKTIGSKYPGLAELTKDEIYNRYVEVGAER